MKNKALDKSKLSLPNHKKKGLFTKTSGRVLQMVSKTTPKKSAGEDPVYAQAVQNYEAGLRSIQEHTYEKARTHLQKVATGPNRELADRASIHLNICSQHLDKAANQFKNPEEHFDYAISLMNVGDYVTAREHLDKLAKQSKSDYVSYGLAALDCLTGHVEDALRHLGEAVQANPALRFQARNDSDFQNLVEDPRFTELLYPDPGGELPAPAVEAEEEY
jgi:tetratricopeptide (TPR) repeat protein